jgi:hypothetical protein
MAESNSMKGQEASYVDPLENADDDTHWRAWNRNLPPNFSKDRASDARTYNTVKGGHETSSSYLSRWYKIQENHQPNEARVWGQNVKDLATFTVDDLKHGTEWQNKLNEENRRSNKI